MVYDMLINNGYKVTHSLEACCIRYLGINPYGPQLSLFSPYIPKKIRNNFTELTTAHITYAATDVAYTLAVRDEQLKLLDKLGLKQIANVENNFVKCLGEMEYNGIKLDVLRWMELVAQNKPKVEKAQAILEALAPINWNSEKQVKDFFRKSGIPIPTKDGKETIQATELQDVQHPIIKDYIKYKTAVKAVTSFGENFLEHVDKDGRIHTSFMQIKHTGRISSANPNMQNIPKSQEYRRCFVPEEGNVFITFDYPSQELNVAADRSKDVEMITALRNKESLHLKTARILYEDPTIQEDDPRRQHGKTTNFAVLYGAGPSKLHKVFGVTLGKAKQMIANYFNLYSGLKSYFNDSIQASLTNNYITIDVMGRKYFLDPRLKEMERLRKYSPIVAEMYSVYKAQITRLTCNYPIQGTGALMIKLALIFL